MCLFLQNQSSLQLFTGKRKNFTQKYTPTKKYAKLKQEKHKIYPNYLSLHKSLLSLAC